MKDMMREQHRSNVNFLLALFPLDHGTTLLTLNTGGGKGLGRLAKKKRFLNETKLEIPSNLEGVTYTRPIEKNFWI